MKIKVKPFLTLRKAMGDQALLEIEAEGITIKGILEELCNRFGQTVKDMIFDRDNRIGSKDIRILVNGRNYNHLPRGLDTELKEGDEICIFPLIAGG